MFVSKPSGTDPLVGSILREFSNDLKGQYLENVLANRKKTYWQKIKNGDQRSNCNRIPKMEGFKEKINMDVMKNVVSRTTAAVGEACNNLNFKRNSKTLTVQSTTLQRHISCSFISRLTGQNFKTYLRGLKNISFPVINSQNFEIVLQLLEKYKPELLQEDCENLL